jgi:hypothetical protein
MGGMSWFKKRRTPRPEPETPPAGPREEVHSSPALEALVARLSRSAPPSILDLGPAVGANVEFFSRFAGRLSIADFLGSLANDEALAVRFHEHPAAVLPELLPPPGDERELHDVVLAWDMLNYLTREQLNAVGAHLGRLTRPGAHLLALVATVPEIPAEPGTYRIKNGATLCYTTAGSRPRKSPRWAPAELGRSLARFTVDRSYLLRHGVQEYLMLRKDDD